jgi:phosphomannomutase
MPINPDVFKAYDIRGLSPEEIDPDFAYQLGQAFVLFTGAKTVVVGRDMRETTPILFEALAAGVNSMGADVIDIGMVTTPMFYFAVGDHELHDAGIMITASHNPSEYNGFKMVFGDVMPIGIETGIDKIRELTLAGPYEAKARGIVVATDIRSAYVAKLFSLIDVENLRPLKVVVDTANGMGALTIADILDRVKNVTWEGMFLDLDGRFPNHEANPLKEETLVALKKRVLETHADLGVAFDGDADRIGLIDETGQHLRGDMILALLAPVVLDGKRGEKVLYTVNSSMVVPEEIAAAGGVSTVSRVGHALVKPQMKRERALFAGEVSGHFFFRDLANAECPDLVMLMVFALLSRTGKSLSELYAPLQRYFHSGEINSKVADKNAAFARLRAKYAAAAMTITEIDGLRMDFNDPKNPSEDWWWSIRPSNTEPLLRLTLEAKKKEKMEAMREEMLEIIRG